MKTLARMVVGKKTGLVGGKREEFQGSPTRPNGGDDADKPNINTCSSERARSYKYAHINKGDKPVQLKNSVQSFRVCRRVSSRL